MAKYDSQMGFDINRDVQEKLRDKVDANGQKLVFVMNKLVEYYLKHGLPKEDKND